MRKSVWLLVLLLAGGCSHGTGDTGPADGRAIDAENKDVVEPHDSWESKCLVRTQAAVGKEVKNPKSARFETPPSYEAYYDKTRDVTVLVVKGIVTSKGNYGQTYYQNFYVTWEHAGEPDSTFKEDEPWTQGEVTVFDPQV